MSISDFLNDLINKDSKEEKEKEPEPTSKCTAPSVHYEPQSE